MRADIKKAMKEFLKENPDKTEEDFVYKKYRTYSENEKKIYKKIQKEFFKARNKKQEAVNRILSYLKMFEYIVIQNENLAAWKKFSR